MSRRINLAPQTFSIWFRRIFEHHDVAGLRSWQAQARNALFDSWRHDTIERTERMLEQHLLTPDTSPSTLHEAMSYAVLGGGKRVRPLLCQAARSAAGANPVALDMVSAALEMMHIYSLVGDALQSQAFITLRRVPLVAAHQALLMGELAMAVGSLGMAGGQMIDISSIGQELGLAQLEQMHQRKTGALIRAALRMAGLCADDAPPFDLAPWIVTPRRSAWRTKWSMTFSMPR
ncbi:polyprenyl synthetase family protein [Pseudomonas synxantha]|uniref:polyprenyl synthetase family protein n=1 Tax=Pseudomonas synxantha TaxID=47883 RepID=UPI002405F09D|nr:polyprenyl synthetase family protein [Pseudomonas synxantha]